MQHPASWQSRQQTSKGNAQRSKPAASYLSNSITWPPAPAMQKFLQQKIRELWMTSDISEIVARRTRMMTGLAAPVDRSNRTLSIVNSVAQKDGGNENGGSGREAFAYLRFMLNALPTTRRSQEGPANCIFGCPDCSGRDDLQHYAPCPRARRIIRLATAEPKPQLVFTK